MEKMVEISNSLTLPAFLSVPDKEKIYPGIILIHEIWGLDDHIKAVTNRYASEAGYAVLAPDLFAGTPVENAVSPDLFAQMHDPAKRDEAQKKMRAALAPMQSPEFAKDMLNKLEMCVSYLEKQKFCNSKIGVLGFCFGGSYSFALAAAQPKIKAAVPFYGQAPSEDKIEKINCPILAFYGEEDTNLVDNLESLKAQMKKYKKDFISIVYPDAGHAFFNDTNPRRYNNEAAQDAWKKSIAFLSENLK
jgi:carboxymethylenebutenolidase